MFLPFCGALSGWRQVRFVALSPMQGSDVNYVTISAVRSLTHPLEDEKSLGFSCVERSSLPWGDARKKDVTTKKTITLHWVVAVGVSVSGWARMRSIGFPKGPLRVDARSTHIVVGVVSAMALAYRVLSWRRTHGAQFRSAQLGLLGSARVPGSFRPLFFAYCLRLFLGMFKMPGFVATTFSGYFICLNTAVSLRRAGTLLQGRWLAFIAWPRTRCLS